MDFNVHCYVGHHRYVQASNPPIEVEVTNSSGTKTKTMVKPLTHWQRMVLYIFITPKPRYMVNGSFGPGTKG